MQRFLSLALIGSLAALSGCASMNSAECMTSDWYAIGFEDGAKGASATRIANHRKACAKHGVTPDLQSYNDGREAGLGEYCRPANGYNLGVRGGNYNGVCPPDSEYDFIQAYNSGRERYQMVEAVRSVERQLQTKSREFDKVREELQEKETALIADSTSSGERAILLNDTRELSKRLGELEAEMLALEREVAVREDRLAEYEAAVVPEF